MSSSTFVAKRTGGACHGCGLRIRRGQEAQYAHPDWPHGPEYEPPGTGVLWHRACVFTALREALCPSCHLLHKPGEPGGTECLL